MKPSFFHQTLRIASASTILLATGITVAVPVAPVWAQANRKAGEPIISEELPFRWNMSFADAKAAAGTKHPVTLIGNYTSGDLYRFGDVSFRSRAKDAVPFALHLRFKNDRLDAFVLLPEGESVGADFVGVKESMKHYTTLADACNNAFGNSYKKSKYVTEENVPTDMPGTSKDTQMVLGFKVNYHAWQDWDASYRLSHLDGGDVGLVRLQGRVGDVPYISPVPKKHNNPSREAVAKEVFDAFYVVDPAIGDAILENKRYFQPPTPTYWGDNSPGFGFRWNMTPEEFAKAALPDKTYEAKSKKGKSLQTAAYMKDSPLRWTYQAWFDKNGLCEFEMRPQNETHSASLHGIAETEPYQKELEQYIARFHRIPTDKWWIASRGVDTEKENKYSQTRWVQTPDTQQGYAIINAEGGYNRGSYTVYGTKQPVTITYKEYRTIPVSIPFTIVERAWRLNTEYYFRQSLLFKSTSGADMGVVRLQGRRGAKKNFYPGTGGAKMIRTKDAKGDRVLREVFENYGVPEGKDK